MQKKGAQLTMQVISSLFRGFHIKQINTTLFLILNMYENFWMEAIARFAYPSCAPDST